MKQTKAEKTDLEKVRGSGLEGFDSPFEKQTYNYTVYTISLQDAAVTNECVELAGEIIYYMEGQSRIRIKMENNARDFIELYPGRKITCPFNRFYLDAPQADEVIKLIVAAPYWVEVGGYGVEVNQLIRDKSGFRETELNRSFIGGGICEASPGDYSSIHLSNGTASDGSGVITILERFNIDASASMTLHMGYQFGIKGTHLTLGRPKRAANTWSACSLRILQDAVLTNHYDYLIGSYMLPVDTTFSATWENSQSIILRPGFCLSIVTTIVGQSVMGYFEWIELPDGDLSGYA